jgi:hypothetical protein
MRVETVSSMKGNASRRGHDRPSAGTKLGDLYDLFKANEGIPIAWRQGSGRSLEQLQDFYGLDIRCIRSGIWVLAGEWFGSEYVDYIARRIAERSRD